MDTKKADNNQWNRNRFLKLSLKKNKIKDGAAKSSSSEVIVLDDSFDKLRPDFAQNKPHKNCSPIVILDSCESSFEAAVATVDDDDDDLPEVILTLKEPSKSGNVSFNCSKENTPKKTKDSRPSIGGWSPAQNILCATPRHETMPSTPRDKANESLEQCSLKKIQVSQKKLLDDLYGNTWKSIPSLFKTISSKYDDFDGVSKKLQFDDEDKENIRHGLEKNKQLYLTSSDIKRNIDMNYGDSEKKSKKKLYTEKIPSTPDILTKLPKSRNVNSTTKKTKVKKGMSVTELVEVMKKDVDILTSKIDKVKITPEKVERLSFMGSLGDNVPSWRCNIEAIQYIDNYNTLKEQLARRLFNEFNKNIFGNAMDHDMPIIWDSKLRSTAGTTTNRLIKTARGERLRTSSVKLSSKVLDAPRRLRDTLVHELCHAATWLLDAELRAGHGPLWRKWAKRALTVYPELGEITRCHDMVIHYKYCYKCTKCGYSVKRHSKSIDITKKCCGYCRGTFELVINKKNKDGVVVSTPARKGTTNEFAQYVKDNYASHKAGRTHAQVMKVLGEQFSARKNGASS